MIKIFNRFIRLSHHRPALFGFIALLILWLCSIKPHLAMAEGFSSHLGGYIKSLNLFTATSGFVPEFTRNPLLRGEEDENLFNSLNRLRLQTNMIYKWEDGQRLQFRADYDHQAQFGSFVGSGDFRIQRNQIERAQFLDLSQTFLEKDNVFYEHRFYRLSLTYASDVMSLEVGRQQIPWGVGHFFTPTDVFNPFNPTQVELKERYGVDALNIILNDVKSFKTQLIFTPSGKELHPQRYLAKISKDLKGYEVSVLGGRVSRDHVMGFDVSGNIKDFAVRGEFLYREAQLEKDFIKFTVNADYNFPYNIYALLEYHYNGQGRGDPKDYQVDRLIDGEIQQMGKNYVALSVGRDLTPLLRVENRTILNADDQSIFTRPEIQYEVQENMLLTGATQLFLGSNDEEFGQPKNLFILEAKYNF